VSRRRGTRTDTRPVGRSARGAGGVPTHNRYASAAWIGSVAGEDARGRRAWRQRRDASRCRIRSYAVRHTAIVVSMGAPLMLTSARQVSSAHARLHPKSGDAKLGFRGRSTRPSECARKGGHYVREGLPHGSGAPAGARGVQVLTKEVSTHLSTAHENAHETAFRQQSAHERLPGGRSG